MERTGIEPVTSGLQSHQEARRHLTGTDQKRMVEPRLLLSSNSTRHRSTALRSHRARTAGA
jgi:hypothetical protein